MKRSILGLFSALFLVPAMALGQNQGVVYYTAEDGTGTYQVNGDATGQSLTFPFYTMAPTARGDYAGGRQFLRNVKVGTIPGTTEGYFDITSRNVAGESKQVTDFDGPSYISHFPNIHVQWSNDGLDSFLTFKVYDAATATLSLYRAHVTPAEIADPFYEPLVPGDRRLELVIPNCGTRDYRWDGTGTRVFYWDDSLMLRAKTIGAGTTPADDPIVFNPVAAGLTNFNVLQWSVSPTADQVVIHTKYPNTRKDGSSGGLMSIDLPAGTWKWLVYSNSMTTYYGGRVRFSPDGTLIAFNGHRTVVTGTGKNTTSQRVYGVYKMPATGGPLSLLTETPRVTPYPGLIPQGWCW